MDRLHKYYETLELDKILAMAAELTCCDDAAELIKNTKPITDYSEVCREVAKTDCALTLSTRFGTPEFFRIKNPNAALKRAEAGGSLNTTELLNVARILRQARSLNSWYNKSEENNTPVSELFSSLVLNRELEDKISSAIISEDEIDDNASAELSQIRRKMKNLRVKVRENLESLVRSQSMQKYLQDSIITMRSGRFVLPIKAEFKGSVSGLVHDTSATGSTLFIEPTSVVEANNEIRVLESKEAAEIERIIFLLSQDCAACSVDILNDFDIAVQINVCFAKANLAAKMNAFAPNITNDGVINLIKARHPLIDKTRVVPVDVSLGKDYDTLLITGPNTGGKTVTLKILGLMTLMCMCGLLIPAAIGSTVSVFDKVLVDIGDEQSIEQNLSTFSSHITNIVSILNVADEKSLVLVDELGSGTDPIEGAALAISILEELKKKGAKTASTTHYAELKIYALENDRVENASCEFNIHSLQPTYRLIIGTPGRSNAFAISKKLGISQNVLEYAQQIVSEDNKKFEDVVDKLEASRKEFEKKTRQVTNLKIKLKNENAQLQKKLDQLEKEKKIEIDKAREQAKRIVDDVRLRSDALIEELDSIRKQKDKAEFSNMAINAKSKVRSSVDKLYDEANPVDVRKNTGYKLPRPLKTGDSVLIFDIDKKATVITPADKSGNVYVQAGIMKTRVPLSNLRLIEEKKVQISGKTMRTVRSKTERNITSEVDLRGKTVEEAIMELDMFIDNAVLSNVSIINIIHGKGTGVLRKAVAQHLKSHRNIKTYRLGVYGEGEDGVTIAELK